jgi:hypothetical protein
MTGPVFDSAARAALWEAYRQHGMLAWAPTRNNPRRAQYAHALLLGWLWEPRPGALAITAVGLEQLRQYMPRRARTDRPEEQAR